jgi:hypothetical protein
METIDGVALVDVDLEDGEHMDTPEDVSGLVETKRSKEKRRGWPRWELDMT